MPPYRYGNKLGLDEEKQPVDAESDNRDDEQNEQHVLARSAPLGDIDQVTESACSPPNFTTSASMM